MPTSLNDAVIAKARKDAKAANKRIELADSAERGLRLRIGASGDTATWTFFYKALDHE